MGIKYIPRIKIKAVIDIVLCIDCTNGGAIVSCMAPPIIRFLKSLDSIDVNYGFDWRARVVGYGDLEIGEKIQNSNEFVFDVDSIERQFSNLKGYAGGDEPESTLDAICYATKQSDWRKYCHKVVIVLTDAHTKGIHSSTEILFAIHDVEELKWVLLENKIRLCLWAPKDPVYESFKSLPKSKIFLLDDANGILCSGKTELTEYLDWRLF